MHRGWTGQGDGRYVLVAGQGAGVLELRRSYHLGESRVHGGCDHQDEKASITGQRSADFADECATGGSGE